jgi:hypothetical protein
VWLPLVDSLKLYDGLLRILATTSPESFGSGEVSVGYHPGAAVRTQTLVKARKEKKQGARVLKP